MATCPSDQALSRYLSGALDTVASATVQEHLGSCPECLKRQAAMHGPDTALSPPGRGMTGPDRRAPAHVGRYEVRGRIAAGGMGEVHEAFDPELRRRLALKFLRADLSGSSGAAHWSARMLREAQAMAQLSHPNVIAVHDAGTYADQVFIAMELVQGDTLQQWADRAPRPWREVLDVALQAGEGLLAAHQAGIVHRDFKPGNVLVDAAGRARVLDFGLAAASAAEAQGDRAPAGSLPEGLDGTAPGQMTLAGQMGTPGYMSPEQLEGAPTDGRSDQFSFCVTLYELLAGVRPFAGYGLEEYGRNVKERRLQPAQPSRPVPEWIHRILLRGLAQRPEDRFPSMRELLAALRSDPTRVRRRLGPIAAGTLALLALAVLATRWLEGRARICSGAERKLAGLWDQDRMSAVRRAFAASGRGHALETFRRVRSSLDRWTQDWVAMHQEACEATRIRGEQPEADLALRMDCLAARRQELAALVDVFARPEPDTVDKATAAAGALPAVGRCADLAALRAPEELPADEAARARLEALRGEVAVLRALLVAGRYLGGVEAGRELLPRIQAAGHRPLEGQALTVLGELEMEAGELVPAAASLQGAVRLADAGRDDRTRARAAIVLAQTIGHKQGQYAQGLSLLDSAAGTVDRLGGDLELRGSLDMIRSTLLWKSGRLEEARAAAERALADRTRVLGAQHPDTAQVHNNLGNIYQAMGDHDRAGQQYRLGLAGFEQSLGAEHPVVALGLNNLGAHFWDLGQLEEARRCFERSVQIRERALKPDHPAVAKSLINLGSLEQSLGRLEEARRALERAAEIQEKALGADHPDVVPGLVNLAGVLLESGQPQQALDRCRRADQINERSIGAQHPDRSYALTCMAEALVALKRPQQAVPMAQQALQLIGSSAPPSERAETEFVLATALWDAGASQDRAVALARSARRGYEEGGEARRVRRVEEWMKSRGLSRSEERTR